MGTSSKLLHWCILIVLLGLILLPLVLPHCSSPAEPRRIEITLTEEERPTERYVDVTVRYYTARESGELVATERFRKIPLEDGTYTVHLGSSVNEEDAEWKAKEEDAPEDVLRLMAEHGRLYYTVALTGRDAPTRRIPLDPDDLSHCVCG